MQQELDQLLILLLSQEANERLTLKDLAHLDSRQSVLRETEVKVIRDCLSALALLEGE
jgi:hypothetical protein